MKKLMMIAVMALSVVFAASARDEYSRDVNVLPIAAKTILKNNFKSGVNHIKIDRELGNIKDYTVILVDGTEVEFDKYGNWTDIEVAPNKSVPVNMLPKGIMDYVKANQKGTRIVGIEKNRNGYDVELSNGVEMKFNSDGVFKKYDR